MGNKRFGILLTMRIRTSIAILSTTCGFFNAAPADQMAVSGMATIDTRFQNVVHSAPFAVETRPWDGANDSSNSGLFTLDARTAAPVGLAITGPTSVIGGAQAAYSIHNAGVDVSIQATLGFAHAPVIFAGIGGNTLFTYPVSAPQTVYLLASYRGPGGQIQSASFPVAILPNSSLRASATATATPSGGTSYGVVLNGSASGGTPPYSFHWDTDNDGQYDDHSVQMSSYPLTSQGGTYLIKLEVTDAVGAKAYATTRFTVDKAPVVNQPVDPQPTPDPAPPGFLDMNGSSSFVFDPNKKANGLLVITHGINSGVGDDNSWLSTMAGVIQGRLGSAAPNILIFDWHEDARVGVDQAMKDQLADIAATVRVEDGILAGLASKTVVDSLMATDWVLEIWSMRISQGPKAGRRLADWIAANTQPVGATPANIDPNKTIQLIGHSAGGFCVGECASVLKDRGVLVDMVTMLDTPIVDSWHLARQLNPGFVERYNSSFLGFLQTGEVLPYRVPLFWRYHVSANVLNWVDFFNPGEFGHGWSHTWYTSTVIDGTHDGFYHSPFLLTGNAIPKSSGALMDLREQSATTADSEPSLPDQPLTSFTTFGNVASSATGYTFTEQADAGITQTIAIPVGADRLRFRYQFTTAGDGDFLEVRLSGYPALYVGEDLPFSRVGFVEASIPVLPYDGQTHTLTFTLVSRGAANAVLQIEDIRFNITDDPDSDGLTTDQELVAGSLPLKYDSDGDTLSDGDEINLYFTNPMLADSDGDGASDSAELTAGTSPTNGQSFLRVTDMTKNTGGTFTLHWPSQVGRFYNVQRSADVTFATFDVIGQGVAAVLPQNTFVDASAGSAPNGRFFYRIEVYAP